MSYCLTPSIVFYAVMTRDMPPSGQELKHCFPRRLLYIRPIALRAYAAPEPSHEHNAPFGAGKSHGSSGERRDSTEGDVEGSNSHGSVLPPGVVQFVYCGSREFYTALHQFALHPCCCQHGIKQLGSTVLRMVLTHLVGYCLAITPCHPPFISIHHRC